MLVKFYCDAEESSIWHVCDDLSDDELRDMACDWVADNVSGYYEMIDSDDLL